MATASVNRLAVFSAALLLAGCYQSHSSEGARPPPGADGGTTDAGRCGDELCTGGDRCCRCPVATFAYCARPTEPCVSCMDMTPLCGSDEECLPGLRCELPPGTCSGLGTCVPRPTGCGRDCPGVCGCDGVDYCNRCEVAMAGVSLSSDAPCGPIDDVCASVFDCLPGQFCRFDGEQCGFDGALGQCQPRPACSGPVRAACGCDGSPYDDGCRARSNGVDVAPAFVCAEEALERACDTLCALAPECDGEAPPDCEDVCREIFGGCSAEEQVEVFGCSQRFGCDVITDCLDSVSCFEGG